MTATAAVAAPCARKPRSTLSITRTSTKPLLVIVGLVILAVSSPFVACQVAQTPSSTNTLTLTQQGSVSCATPIVYNAIPSQRTLQRGSPRARDIEPHASPNTNADDSNPDVANAIDDDHKNDDLRVSTSQEDFLISESKHLAPAHPPVGSWQFWSILAGTVVLVVLGGIFAGLTIGIMSLDATNLHILMNSGTGSERRYAETILPIRKHGHWVLSTLLLGNVVVNETLPILFDRIVNGGIVAVVLSTSLVVIFGEIIPNAICARYGLAIGAYMAPFVRLCMWVFSPVAYPVAKTLDYVLGHSEGTIYARAELKTLVHLHQQGHPGGELIADEVSIIGAVLDLMDKNVEKVMTPLADVFSVNIQQTIDAEFMKSLISKGHSRIPVYQHSKENVIAILLTKKLLGYNVALQRKVKDFPLMYLPIVDSKTNLFDMLNFFQEGRSHMAAVAGPATQHSPGGIDELERDNAPLLANDILSSHKSVSPKNGTTVGNTVTNRGILGIITMEDVIEEIIGEEIVDETDEFVDMHTKTPVKRGVYNTPNFIAQHRLNVNISQSSKTLVSSPSEQQPQTNVTSPPPTTTTTTTATTATAAELQSAIPASGRASANQARKPRRDRYQIVNIEDNSPSTTNKIEEWADTYFGSLKEASRLSSALVRAQGESSVAVADEENDPTTATSIDGDHLRNATQVSNSTLSSIIDQNEETASNDFQVDINELDQTEFDHGAVDNSTTTETAQILASRVKQAFDEHEVRLTDAGWYAEPLNKNDARKVLVRKRLPKTETLSSLDDIQSNTQGGGIPTPLGDGSRMNSIGPGGVEHALNTLFDGEQTTTIGQTALVGATRTGITQRSISASRATSQPTAELIQQLVNNRVMHRGGSAGSVGAGGGGDVDNSV